MKPTDADKLRTLSNELHTMLGPKVRMVNLHLTLGKTLLWIAPLLEDHEIKRGELQRLGEAYRQHGLNAYESNVETREHAEALRRALRLALQIVDDAEAKGGKI